MLGSFQVRPLCFQAQRHVEATTWQDAAKPDSLPFSQEDGASWDGIGNQIGWAIFTWIVVVLLCLYMGDSWNDMVEKNVELEKFVKMYVGHEEVPPKEGRW